MKPEELQVGDWVEMNFYSPQPCDDYPDEDWRPIQLVSDDEVNKYANIVYPILLSTYILNKNDFYKTRDFFKINDAYKLKLVADDVNKTHWEIIDLYKTKFNIYYVHEFQHLLRRLKINKEIIL